MTPVSDIEAAREKKGKEEMGSVPSAGAGRVDLSGSRSVSGTFLQSAVPVGVESPPSPDSRFQIRASYLAVVLDCQAGPRGIKCHSDFTLFG